MLLVVAMEGRTTSARVLDVEEPYRSMAQILLWVHAKDHLLEWYGMELTTLKQLTRLSLI